MTTKPASTIKVPAWLIDSDDGGEGGEMGVWLLVGLDPAGTGMAAYVLAEDLDGVGGQMDTAEAVELGLRTLRLLAIEDAYGIELRGPEVAIESPLAAALAGS